MLPRLSPLLGKAQGLPGDAKAEVRDAPVVQPSPIKLSSPLTRCSAPGSRGLGVRPPAAASDTHSFCQQLPDSSWRDAFVKKSGGEVSSRPGLTSHPLLLLAMEAARALQALTSTAGPDGALNNSPG